MKRKILLIPLVLLIIGGLIAGCAAPAPAPAPAPATAPAPAPAPDEVIRLKYNSTFPPGHPVWYDSESLMMERIQELSDGRVEIVGYPGVGLLARVEIYDGIKAGMGDFSGLFPHHLPGQFRVAEMFMLPFLDGR